MKITDNNPRGGIFNPKNVVKANNFIDKFKQGAKEPLKER